jgi:hypothetical protein
MIHFAKTFVAGSGSGPNKLGEPFGYLKSSSTLNSINLFVFPYNYPKLWPLLGSWYFLVVEFQR